MGDNEDGWVKKCLGESKPFGGAGWGGVQKIVLRRDSKTNFRGKVKRGVGLSKNVRGMYTEKVECNTTQPSQIYRNLQSSAQ